MLRWVKNGMPWGSAALQPYAEQLRAVMTLAGNHEVGWDNTTGAATAFQGYIHRYRMPQARPPTEITSAPIFQSGKFFPCMLICVASGWRRCT